MATYNTVITVCTELTGESVILAAGGGFNVTSGTKTDALRLNGDNLSVTFAASNVFSMKFSRAEICGIMFNSAVGSGGTISFASGSISVENTITTGGKTTGIYSLGGLMFNSGFGGSLSVIGYMGTGSISADISTAGIRAGGALSVTGGFTGTISVSKGADELLGITAAGIMIDNFAGKLLVQNGTQVRGISGSTGGVSIASFGAAGTISLTGDKFLFGIYTNNGSVSVLDFAGKISIAGTVSTASADTLQSFGIRAAGGSIAINSFTGAMVVSAYDIANGISVDGSMLSGTGGTVFFGTGSRLAAFNIRSSYVYALSAEYVNLSLGGILFAGTLPGYASNNDGVLAMLEDYKLNGRSSQYYNILVGAVNAKTYAISLITSKTPTSGSVNKVVLEDDSITFGHIKLYTAASSAFASTVIVKSGAELFGDVESGHAADSFTIYAGAQISGAVKGNRGEDTISLEADQDGLNRTGVIGGELAVKNLSVNGGSWQVGSLGRYTSSLGGTQVAAIAAGAKLAVGTIVGQTISGAGGLSITGLGGSGNILNFTGDLSVLTGGSIMNVTAGSIRLNSLTVKMKGAENAEQDIVVGNVTGYTVGSYNLDYAGTITAVDFNTNVELNGRYHKFTYVNNNIYIYMAAKYFKSYFGNGSSINMGYVSDAMGTAADVGGQMQVNMTVTDGEVLRMFYAGGNGSVNVDSVIVTLDGGEYNDAQLRGGMLSQNSSVFAKNINFTINKANQSTRILAGNTFDNGSGTLEGGTIRLNINAGSSDNGWVYGGNLILGSTVIAVNNALLENNIAGAFSIGNFVAAGRSSDGNASMRIDHAVSTLTSVTVKHSIFNGSYLDEGTSLIGTATTVLTGVTAEGGIWSGYLSGTSGVRVQTVNSLSLTLNNTRVTGNAVFTAGYCYGAGSYSMVTQAAVSIANGSIIRRGLYGGGHAVYGGTSNAGSVSITIDGTSRIENSDVWGGGYVAATGGTARVDNTTITIKSGAYIGHNIYAGGYSTAAGGDVYVNSATIIFDGVNASFSGFVSGNGYGGKNADSVGDSTLVFKDYSGQFNGYVSSHFNHINFVVTNSALTGGVTIANNIFNSNLIDIGIKTQISYSADFLGTLFDLASGAVDFSKLRLNDAVVSEVNPIKAGSFSLVWQLDSSTLFLAGATKAADFAGDGNYKIFSLA